MTNEIEQGLHERLCAYVLGEATDEVRAEVERALEASAELRAEREHLEKTIGFVQEAMAGSETLPPGAVAEICADARKPRHRPWYARPALRIAAAISAIAIAGVLAFRAMEARRTRAGIELAELPRKLNGSGRMQPAPEEADAGAKSDAGLLAYAERMTQPAPADAARPSAGPAAPAAAENTSTLYHGPSDTVPSVVSSLTVDSLERLDAMDGDHQADEKLLARIVTKEEQERLRNLGYASPEPPTVVDGSEAVPATSEAMIQGQATPPPFVGSVGGTVSKRMQGRAAGARLAGPGSAGPQSSGGRAGELAGATTSSDDFSMGGGKDAEGSGSREESGFRAGLSGLGYLGVEEKSEVHGRDFAVFEKARRVDPIERERWIEDECRRIVTHCRRRPSERPRDMFFRFYGDNPFEFASLDPQSTFSVDVDTASYALARRYLDEGNIPGKAQIRTEEFVNYFKADVQAPTKGTFAIHTDLAPSRFSSDKQRWMLRVVVRGREVAKAQRQPLNLTFVIDVSGSMREQNRLEMVKHAIRLLVSELGAGDNIALVAFSTDARTVLPMTPVRNRSAIEAALFPLQPENSTNSEAGLKLGYSVALANINPEAQNRVVFLSDGVANVGETDPVRISDAVKPIREKGIYLNTIGVGMNNHNDVLLERLANKGDGVCNYVDTPDEARKVIVDGFTGAFETIARDVKVQVEFDPAQVERYRLLGYENRAIADQDFRNDEVDAGEVGAGHQVTALYELELGPGAAEKPLATVHLRWKAPRSVAAPAASEEATEIAHPVLASQRTSFEGAAPGYRRAVVVAQFAEFLRRSVHARGDSLDDLILEAAKLERETADPEVTRFVGLLRKSRDLILRALPDCDDLCQTIEAIRRNALLRCERESLAREVDGHVVAELEKQNAELEQRIRELLRRKLEQEAK